MGQRVITDNQKVIDFSQDDTESVRLRVSRLYRELILNLESSITADVGDAIDAANLKAGGLWGLIKKISVILNGSTVIYSMTGEELRWWNFFTYGTRDYPQGADAAGVLHNLTSASSPKAIQETLILPFWSPRSFKPMDTILNTRKVQELRVEVQWGSITDVTSAASASLAAASTKLRVCSLESFGIQPKNLSMKKIFRIQETNISANDEYQVELPVTSMYRGLLINTKDASDNDVGTLVDNIKLKSGGTTIFDLPWKVAQRWSRIRSGVYRSFDEASGEIDSVFVPDASNLDGWLYIDFATDGRMTEIPDARGLAEMILEFDINATLGKLVVLPITIDPPAAAA